MNENSLANLQPPWQPGQSGNPAGRPAAGASVIEWMNVMAEWPEDEIETMAEDPQAPANKRTAARRWLAAMDDEREREAREAVEFVCDYTNGRPRQTAIIRHETPAMVDAKTARAIQSDPVIQELARKRSELAQQAIERIRQLAGEEEQPLEVVADVEAVEMKED